VSVNRAIHKRRCWRGQSAAYLELPKAVQFLRCEHESNRVQPTSTAAPAAFRSCGFINLGVQPGAMFDPFDYAVMLGFPAVAVAFGAALLYLF
jgi:hypothetical protein